MSSTTLTVKQKIFIASAIAKDWAMANTYIGIGHVPDWDGTTDILIPRPNNSTDVTNDVFNNLVSLQKIYATDTCLVIPRVDWANNTTYGYYANNIDIFSTTNLMPGIGNATINLTVSSTTTQVIGNNTAFTTFFSTGSFIETLNPNDNSIEIKEIIAIDNDTLLFVNSAYSATYTTNVYYRYENTFPNYSNNFYVRNTNDQVFKCLYNGGDVASTIMPEISLGGNLPSNPAILTSDGYYWKYMYTIPGGLKQKFFTPEWMPVTNDPLVVSSAVSGRIDYIEVINGGTGYNNSVASNVASIINVSGNGTGANVIAKVDNNGTITDLVIQQGGSGYTYATVTANAGSTGVGASFFPVISPENGNGSNSYYELGATNLMLCVELSGNGSGTIPVGSMDAGLTTSGLYSPFGPVTPFTYHQISIIQNPILTANTIPASNSNYLAAAGIRTVTPSNQFLMNDTAYQGPAGNPTFSGTIVTWDNINNIVYLNNIKGTYTPREPLLSSTVTGGVITTGFIESQIQSGTGDIGYIENRPAITRYPGQTEQIKLVLEI